MFPAVYPGVLISGGRHVRGEGLCNSLICLGEGIMINWPDRNTENINNNGITNGCCSETVGKDFY